MNIFSQIREQVIQALNALANEGVIPAGLDFANVAVEPPRDRAHGDMATNAAMVLAKLAGKKPRDIAEALAEKLVAIDMIDAADVAGPGFLNLRLAGSVWSDLVARAAEGTGFGRSDMGQRQKVNVEFVSANPTGP